MIRRRATAVVRPPGARPPARRKRGVAAVRAVRDRRALQDRATSAAEVRELGEPAPLHEHEALASLAQDLQVERLVRMHAEEHDVALAPQALEELEHEADVAVLDRELRLVEQVHERPRRDPARSQQERRHGAPIGAHLVRLVVVDRKPVALAVADPVHVAAVDQHAARGRRVAAGEKLEQRRLAGAVRAHDADRPRRVDGEIRRQRERLATRPAAARNSASRALRREPAEPPSIDPQPAPARARVVAQRPPQTRCARSAPAA